MIDGLHTYMSTVMILLAIALSEAERGLQGKTRWRWRV
jgi:hypothetical protein